MQKKMTANNNLQVVKENTNLLKNFKLHKTKKGEKLTYRKTIGKDTEIIITIVLK